MLAAKTGVSLPVIVASSNAGAGNAVTLTVNKPTGTASGDTMYAFVWGQSFATLTLTGWTQVFIDVSQTIKFAVFKQTAGGSEPSAYSFTGTVGGRSCVMVTTRGGAGLINVQATGINALSSATSTALSITATVLGLLFASFGNRTNTTITTPPSGMTFVDSEVAASAGVVSALYRLSPSTAGATGNKSLVWAASVVTGGWLVQIY